MPDELTNASEVVIAVRNRLKSTEASLRSTEGSVQGLLDKLEQQNAVKRDLHKNRIELRRWLEDNGLDPDG